MQQAANKRTKENNTAVNKGQFNGTDLFSLGGRALSVHHIHVDAIVDKLAVQLLQARN